MNETKPKRRLNRGFLVSMVLLSAVVLYVTATQLMLIPQKNDLKKTADSVRLIYEDISTISREDAENLQSNQTALAARQTEIQDKLSPPVCSGFRVPEACCKYRHGGAFLHRIWGI